MAQNKPLFIPWLQQQIDSAQYPGVQWTNPEHTLFTVPWKHALRQDSNSDDVRIFRAWAQTSVSPDGRIPGDPSVWKRNFRSALRARGFQVHRDNKNDAANPHKVIKWPEDAQSGESRDGSQDCDTELPVCEELYLEAGGLTPPDVLQQCLLGLNIGEPGQAVDEHFFIGPVRDDQYLAGGAVGCLGQISPAEGAVALGQFSPLEGAFTAAEELGLGDQISVQETPNDAGLGQFKTHFRVTVYYKGTKVSEQLVENELGFRLVSRNDPSLMADGLAVVELPNTDSILDQIQAWSTREVLDNLGGLEVRKRGGDLLGHRWGDVRIYWGPCKHERGSEPRPVAKNHPEPIYFFKNFRSELIEFMEKHRQHSPSYTLYFSLGQIWPDPKNKPWEKKLVTVEVVLTALERLKQMAVELGASSLQSDELQISLEQIMEMD